MSVKDAGLRAIRHLPLRWQGRITGTVRNIRRVLRTGRRAIAPALQRLPLGAGKVHPPRSWCLEAKTWIETHESAGASYHELRPATRAVISELPRSIDANVHWRFRRYLDVQVPPDFVACIPHGRVQGDAGAVITPDDRLLSDLSYEMGRCHGGKSIANHSILARFSIPVPRRLPGKTAVLTATGGSTFFHWMYDVLPRVGLMREAGIALDEIDHFAINPTHAPFQRESLSLLGIPENRLVACDPDTHLESDELLVTSLSSSGTHIRDRVAAFLRSTFLDPSLPIPAQARKIYISRQSAAWRRMANASDIEPILARHGFETVTLETMSLREQARLIHDASVIAGVHGAGYSNLIFCRPGTTVLEFFSPNYVHDLYWRVAIRAQLRYYYLIGEGPAPPEGIDPHSVGEDVLVSAEKLEKLVRLAVGFA